MHTRLLPIALAFIVVASACHGTLVPPDPDPDPDPAPGFVAVTFTGLPAPWSARGYGVLTGASGDGAVFTVVESGSLDDVPPGTYVFEPQTLPLCGVEYVPDRATIDVTVASGSAVQVDVTYSAASVSRVGYRARVTGVHSVVSIEEDVELEATLVLDGDRLTTFGCLRYFELEDFEQGEVAGADVRVGNAADHFVAAGGVMAVLDVVGPACEDVALAAGPGSACTVYLDGSHTLGNDHVAAILAANAYLRVDVPAAQTGALLAPVPGEGVAPKQGGTLVIDIDASVPGEVCLEGPLEAALPADFCVSETTVRSDQLSGTYQVVSIDDGPADAPQFHVDGDPASVAPGVTATVRVEVQVTTF